MKNCTKMADPSKKNLLKITANLLFLGIGLFIFIMVLRLSGESITVLLKKIFQQDCSYLIAILFITIAIFWALSKRWAAIISLYTDISTIPRSYIFYNTSLGVFMSSFFSIFGYVGMKSLSLKVDHNVSALRTSYAGVVEMITGLIVLLSMLLPSVFFVFKLISQQTALVLTAIFLAGLAVGFRVYYSTMIRLLLTPVFSVMKMLSRIRLLKDRIKPELFDPQTFYQIDRKIASRLLLYTLIGYFCVLANCYVYFWALEIDVSFLQFLLVYPIGYFIASMGITPGNLGIADAGWYGVVSLVGVSGDQAAQYVLAQRIFNVAAYFVITVGSYTFYNLTQSKKSCSVKPPPAS